MRCNRQEMMALAAHPAHSFEREGVLFIKERQDGFFRRTEGYGLHWFRLRGNLLFFLKGPEPWSEPVGFIVLGHHDIRVQPKDENGNWPFQILWENSLVYHLAALSECERVQWIKAIELAPYEQLSSELAVLRERLNRVRPVLDVSVFRSQKGIVPDINEIPLCELALSCDNLLCDENGIPPSPVIVAYVKFNKGLCVRYGATEVVDKSSNPTFSKTILFRPSDGLTGDEIVRLVVYDVKERVSHITIPMGYIALQLSTIQEAQRLRVALVSKDNKPQGFVTINGWSLEPSYVGTSPHHNSNCERNIIDVPARVLCHRRSQSLPPKLGLKLKCPSYSSLFRLNFVHAHQVTYRFHSGLGGDITVHEIMAESKACYQIPIQLLGIYIRRERELLEELMSVGEICGQWVSRQLELIGLHISLLRHYSHSKRRLRHVESPYFKPSCKKDDASLEFAPINLHIQRMWVHNDTLNKSGFHDIVTAGAFTAHTHKAGRQGGLIKLVQQIKEVNCARTALLTAAANKIQSDYDNVVAMRRIRDDIVHDLERMVVMLQAKQGAEIARLIEEIKIRLRSFIALWDPKAVEEALSYITIPKLEVHDQVMTTILNSTERLSHFDNMSGVDVESSTGSSNGASPTADFAPKSVLSASVPNMCASDSSKPGTSKAAQNELQFHSDYFNSNLKSSSRAEKKSGKKSRGSLSLDSSSSTATMSTLRQMFKSSLSLEQMSYRTLMDTSKREVFDQPDPPQLDVETRKNNLSYLQSVSESVEETLVTVYEAVMLALDGKGLYLHAESNAVNRKHTLVDIFKAIMFVPDFEGYDMSDQLDDVRTLMENAKTAMEATLRWMRVAHAAMRLRCESLQWARENAALQTRRDACFSQALTTVTSGLHCWLNSKPSEVVLKVLTSGLGPLCGFEGLLSLFATEKAMWGDMVVAVEDLQTVQFRVTKIGHSYIAVPQVSGARGSLIVHLPVSDSLYSQFVCKEHLTFTITVVFFNIGINEKASTAESLGDTTPQNQSNNDNLDRLNKYYHKYSQMVHDHASERAASSSRAKPLEEVMENLRIAVQKKTPKNVEVLHLAALATRLMNGIRFTSCKSAKDRTGMAVTLEQCSILTSEYHLAEHEYKKALDIMRSDGCRRENTFKNIGIRKYAFTKKQMMALPEEYRPPAGTYGATQQ